MTHYIKKNDTVRKKAQPLSRFKRVLYRKFTKLQLKISEFWMKCLLFLINFFINPLIYLTEERKQSTGKFKYSKQVFKK